MLKTRSYNSSSTSTSAFGRGSNALAVLSCALALLAAHPLAVQAMRSAPPMAVAVQGAAPAEDSVVSVRARSEASITAMARPVRAVRGVEVSAAAQHSLRMLATLEHLGRLLVGEFSPLVVPAVAVDFAQPALDVAIHAAGPMVRGVPTADLPPPREQSYALRHCLLAPPI